MGSTIVRNPPPPPIPKIILFVELVTLAAVFYLVALTIKGNEQQASNFQEKEEGL